VLKPEESTALTEIKQLMRNYQTSGEPKGVDLKPELPDSFVLWCLRSKDLIIEDALSVARKFVSLRISAGWNVGYTPFSSLPAKAMYLNIHWVPRRDIQAGLSSSSK